MRFKVLIVVAFDLEWLITDVWNVRAATISGWSSTRNKKSTDSRLHHNGFKSSNFQTCYFSFLPAGLIWVDVQEWWNKIFYFSPHRICWVVPEIDIWNLAENRHHLWEAKNGSGGKKWAGIQTSATKHRNELDCSPSAIHLYYSNEKETQHVTPKVTKSKNRTSLQLWWITR